jgi:membrane-bound lytic murein transglycosylase D
MLPSRFIYVLPLFLALFFPLRAFGDAQGSPVQGEEFSMQILQPERNDFFAAAQSSAQSHDAALSRDGKDKADEDAGHSAEPRANGVASLISSDMNDTASKAVQKSVGLFSTTIREKFSQWLGRSGEYLDMMKEILRKKDVPEEIVFLSLIESGFNPRAYSMAKAAGPWQFIASTAKRYGLEIDWWKDERRDPVKSTEAAASYLKDLYGMFGSWDLAMAAYNAGEGKILRAIKKTKSDDYWDLLQTKHIKKETKDYVPRFIAASLIANNPRDFGFEDIEYAAPMTYDEVELYLPIDLAVAAKCAETDLDVIKQLNPELRRWCTPPDAESYTLKIPKGTRERFFENLTATPRDEQFTIDTYIVRRGDTLKRIARRTGVPESVILSLNAASSVLPLHVGGAVYLPPAGTYVPERPSKSPVKKAIFRKKKRTRAKRSTLAGVEDRKHGKRLS